MAKEKHESITLTFGCLQGYCIPHTVSVVVKNDADFLFPSLLAGSLINRQSVPLAALNALLKHVDKVLQICLMLTLPILARRPEVDNAVMRRNELITLIEEISQGVACRNMQLCEKKVLLTLGLFYHDPARISSHLYFHATRYPPKL